MRVVEINKYPPSLFKQGRFLQEDWTSCSALESNTGTSLSRNELLRVEEIYLSAAARLASVVPAPLRAHNVEFWDEGRPLLARLGLADVFDGSAAPTEGESLCGPRLLNVMRRCFREVAWLEFTVEPVLLLHFGYDLRLVVAAEPPIDEQLDLCVRDPTPLDSANAPGPPPHSVSRPPDRTTRAHACAYSEPDQWQGSAHSRGPYLRPLPGT